MKSLGEVEQKSCCRGIPIGAIFVSLGLVSPTLFLGFYADDYVHQSVLQGSQPDAPLKPWALYDFGDVETWGDLNGQIASFPWWTDRDWQIRFLRPIASVGLWLQYQAFGGWAPGYHITALILQGCLLLLVHRLFLDLGLGKSAANRGTLLFGVCDSMVMPVGWIANQNSLYVALFGVISLRCLCAQSLPIRNTCLGLLFATAALLSKESGSASVLLAGLVMLHRRATSTSKRTQRSATMGMVASVLILACWAGFVITSGYGTRSLFYATPWSDPLRFTQNLMVLATGGIVSMCGVFPIDLVAFFPTIYLGCVLLGITIAIPLLLWIGSRVVTHSATKWLVAWTVLYMLLQAGGPPSDRLLFVPVIGFAGLLSLFFDSEKQRQAAGSQGRIARTSVLILWLSATVASGSAVVLQSVGLTMAAQFTRDKAKQTMVGPDDGVHREVLILQSENQMQAFTLQPTYMYEHPKKDVTLWNLQNGNRPLRWTRIDERTFELETLGAPFLSFTTERIYLTEEPEFEIGHRWKTAAFEVEVRAAREGYPTILRFEMNHTMNDKHVIFLRSIDGVHARVDPPKIGESVRLQRPERVGPMMP